MNTDVFTTPSPELKQHSKDLSNDAMKVAKDVKNQAAAGANEVKAGMNELKNEAANQVEKARITATDVANSVRGFVKDHPFGAFGIGLLAGLMLGGRIRR